MPENKDEKIYLDIEATAAQVKKGIEEVVGAITNNVLENNGKMLSLNVDTNELPESPTEDELLERVKFVLKEVETKNPTVYGKNNQMIVSDGEYWLKSSPFHYSTFSSTIDETYDELRFGGDLVYNPYIDGKSISRLSLGGNATCYYKRVSPGSTVEQAIKGQDNKTFKLTVGDTAKALFLDDTYFSITDEAKVYINGTGRLVINGAAAADITDSSELFLHDTAKVHIDGGWTHQGSPIINIHGNCQLIMDDGEQEDGSYNYSGDSQMNIATLMIKDKSYMNLSHGARASLTDTSKLYLNGNSTLKMDSETGVFLSDHAHIWMEENTGICMHGGSQIIFNNRDTSDEEKDPILIANPNSLIFVGCGTSGVTGDSVWGSPSTYGAFSSEIFGNKESLIPSNKNTRINIADETMIMIDAANGGGANWIKIGADYDELLQISLTGNIFHQMTGNAHSEIHDNSKFIMRGPIQSSSIYPWNEGFKSDDYRGSHLGEDWTRPIKPTNSPVLGMYDVAQFMMRGVWNTESEDKPLDWNEHLEKIEDQPVVEIIENADIRIYGTSELKLDSFNIIANSNGITFGDGTEENNVTFSISELKKLKSFLTNSDFTND